MTLQDQLNADLRDAMRAGDEVRKTTLRQLLTAVRNAAIPPELEELKPPTDPAKRQEYEVRLALEPVPTPEVTGPLRQELNDEAVLDIVRRQIKQRRDSIDVYRKANRNDLADKEEAEAAILVAYLPSQMTREEIAGTARAIIERVGAHGPADKGKVMPLVMSELRGRAEGRDINEVVSELLAQAAG